MLMMMSEGMNTFFRVTFSHISNTSRKFQVRGFFQASASRFAHVSSSSLNLSALHGYLFSASPFACNYWQARFPQGLFSWVRKPLKNRNNFNYSIHLLREENSAFVDVSKNRFKRKEADGRYMKILITLTIDAER